MREDEPADSGVGGHGTGLREADAQGVSAGQQGEDVALETVVRAGGVACRRFDDPDRGAFRELLFQFGVQPARSGLGEG